MGVWGDVGVVGFISTTVTANAGPSRDSVRETLNQAILAFSARAAAKMRFSPGFEMPNKSAFP
jgi:hypothetical protein